MNGLWFGQLVFLLCAAVPAIAVGPRPGIPPIELSGNEQFTSQEILLALEVDAGLCQDLARSPQTTERTDRLGDSIRWGYAKHGYIDAIVTGEYSAQNDSYRFQIEEKAAIRKCKIEITGIEPELAKMVCDELKKPHRKSTQEWNSSLDGRSLQVRDRGQPDSAGKDADLPGMRDDRYYEAHYFRQIESLARDVFARLGYALARLSIEAQVDRSQMGQTLIIHVLELGKQTQVSAIRCQGNSLHDSEKLSVALGLRVGQVYKH